MNSIATIAAANSTFQSRVATGSVSFRHLKKDALRSLFVEKYGIEPTAGWTADKLALILEGSYMPKSGKMKTALQAKYKSRTGLTPPKSWTCKELSAAVDADVCPLPHSAVGKKEATANYVAKMGVEPAKGWTTEKIVAAAAAEIKPNTRTGGKRADGLTADKCRELIKDALASNRVTVDQVKGRSKMKADELRSLVARLGLAS